MVVVPNGNAVHALVIEDDSMIAEIIQYVLRDCGFTSFDVTTSTRAAIAAAARRCPDLITVDVALAPGNGIEAIRIICAKLSTPVIFITGSPATEIRAQMPNYAVVKKPFSPETLTYTVVASMIP